MDSALHQARIELLYHFCRLQLPGVPLSGARCQKHLQRTFDIYRSKANGTASWDAYLDNLYPLDWYLTAACLEGQTQAWETLFAMRAGRSDCLLLDALRARAARLYPRDEEKQDNAVQEFWGYLYVPPGEDSLPILARYDGVRPLVPWLIRVFQNRHISQLRKHTGAQPLPEDDLALPLPESGASRWHEAFVQATREWLQNVEDDELLLLGLRLRYRLSQREVAALLRIHEGTLSRRTDQLREQCVAFLSNKLVEQGWTGDDLAELIRTEMHSLLLDDCRLSADHLAHLLAKQGKKLPRLEGI